MAHLDMTRTWSLSLDNRETIIVLKALGGRITSESDRFEAAQLGDRLTELRAKLLLDDAVVGERLTEQLAIKK